MAQTDKYLIFSILTEFYGIPIIKVREIIRYEKITPVRKSLEYIKGVINLRGKIIPILDLRTKFGLPEEEYNETTVFIIVDVNGKSGVYNIGITVDAVHEVMDIDKEQVEQTPRLGLKLKSQYLLGIARLREEMAMILNLDMIISADEIIALTE